MFAPRMPRQERHCSMQVTIADVAYRGKGVAKTDNGVIFVPHTLPGEVVEVDITRRRKKFAEARLVGVVTPSPLRASPACPLAGVCPGCCYQHMPYAEEVRLKAAQLAGLLAHLGSADPAICAPPVPSPAEWNYRRKIVLHASHPPAGTVLGYFAEDNTTLIDVPACPLAAEAINGLLAERRASPGFMRRLPTHQRVTFRWTPQDGAMVWQGLAPEKPVALTEESAVGPLHVPAGCFFQVNPPVADALLKAVQEELRRADAHAVMDLYCGVGGFAIAAAQMGARVFGIESSAAAVAAARENAQRLAPQAVMEFLTAPVEKSFAEAWQNLKMEDAWVVVDPPRAGLPPEMIQALCKARPKGILYVACAADTMARDIRGLSQGGYRAMSSRLFDMFPRTPYFESLTRLELVG
jgi:23S rRNA (uracil1939-C5)-methyltransferase